MGVELDGLDEEQKVEMLLKQMEGIVKKEPEKPPTPKAAPYKPKKRINDELEMQGGDSGMI